MLSGLTVTPCLPAPLPGRVVQGLNVAPGPLARQLFRWHGYMRLRTLVRPTLRYDLANDMSPTTRLFLRAKHWQLFLPTFAYGVLGDVLVAWLSTKAASPSAAVQVFAIANALVTAPALICLLLWYWSVGSFLHSMAPANLRPSIAFFRVALLYPPIYISVFFIIVLRVGSPLLALILPFHFFTAYCLLYNLYFLSKSLLLVEKRRFVEKLRLIPFSTYAGAFFLFWFFPIGIWFIQPKINRLYAQRAPGFPLNAAATG